MRKRVLVTGTGGGVGQGILKSLRLIEDLELEVIAADMSALAPGLYVGDRAVLVPGAKSADYIDQMLQLVDREHVDFYLPGTDIELAVCAEARQRFQERGCTVAVSSPKVIEIADDKYATYRFLDGQGLARPKTWLRDELVLENVRYPVIVKPRRGFRSIGVECCDDEAALVACLARRDDEVVIQVSAGDEAAEYTCTVVAGREDELSPVVVLRRDLRAGDTYRAWPVREPRIESYVADCALALEIGGSCNFQLRTDKDGAPRAFEINARFSGTTPFCAHLGMNPVEFWLKRQLGIECTPEVRTDRVILRAWSEVVVDAADLARLEKERSLDAPRVVDRGVL